MGTGRINNNESSSNRKITKWWLQPKVWNNLCKYLFLSFFFGIPQAYRRTPTLITLNIRISPVFVLITITNCSNQPRDFLLSYLFGCFPTEIQLVCSLCVVFFVFLFFYFFIFFFCFSNCSRLVSIFKYNLFFFSFSRE